MSKDVEKAVKRLAFKGRRMRAEDDQLDIYADQYALTSESLDQSPDWDRFYELWETRFVDDESMAALLAEVMGIDYEEALAWIQDRDTP